MIAGIYVSDGLFSDVFGAGHRHRWWIELDVDWVILGGFLASSSTEAIIVRRIWLEVLWHVLIVFTLGEECPFSPWWVEALNAWLRGEVAVGSGGICCSSVISPPCELGGKDAAGRVNSLKKCRQSNLSMGFVESDGSSCQPPCWLTRLTLPPCLVYPVWQVSRTLQLQGSQHTSLLQSLSWRLSHCQGEVGGQMHSEAIQTSKKLN